MSSENNKLENQLNFHSFITEKWFRIIEFSLILGLLDYFRDITNNYLFSAVYLVSWVVFFGWFLVMGEYIAEFIYKRKKPLSRFTINIIATIPFVFLYFVITQVGEIVSGAP